MQWQHKGFCFKMNQLIYSSEHTNVKQAQCLMFLSALCCTWLLPNTETTNHSNVKFVTEISSCRISNVSDCTHANRMFFCCVYGQRWWWYSRLPAVHSAENAPSYLANQASLQLWILAKQSGQAGCTHGRLPLHMDWAWTQETVLSFGRTCSDTWLLVEETHALLTPSLSALSSPETLQQQKALKEQWTQEQQQQFGQKGLQHPKKSVCSQG